MTNVAPKPFRVEIKWNRRQRYLYMSLKTEQGMSSYPLMAKLPPITCSRRNQILTYRPPANTSPGHTSSDQAKMRPLTTFNNRHPKPKPTRRLKVRDPEDGALCQIEVEYPVLKEAATRYYDGQTGVQVVADSHENKKLRRLPVIPQGEISYFKPKVHSRRNGMANQGRSAVGCSDIVLLPSGSDIADYDIQMPQSQNQRDGKQVLMNVKHQRGNSAKMATLIAPSKPNDPSENAWMQSGYVPTKVLEQTEGPTITARNKRLLCRRQDASELLLVASSNGVPTDETYAFPRQAILRAYTNKQLKYHEMHSINVSGKTGGTNFQAHDQEGSHSSLPLSKTCRQRRVCVVEPVQNEENRCNRRTAVCLATDTTIRDREHARVMGKRF